MTRTIKSETTNAYYFLTIDSEGRAVGCTCKDRYYRRHDCKHMTHFSSEVERAATFLALQSRYDVRSQAVIDEKRTNYLRFEMSMGLD